MPGVKRKQPPSSSEPGSNWQALKRKLPPPIRTRKSSTSSSQLQSKPSDVHHDTPRPTRTVSSGSNRITDDREALKSMIEGIGANVLLSRSQLGNYVALDCEMVGVGPVYTNSKGELDTKESSLARVSAVNYHGETLLDVFVKQKEKVTDYRTFVSGVRPKDLIGDRAVTLEEAQKKVADLIDGKVLVGHAVHNDLKALLLSHPRQKINDTQKHPAIRQRFKTNRPGLRNVVKQEFGIDIQAGEHSSVVDARATMALFRLYRFVQATPKTPTPSQLFTARSSAAQTSRSGSPESESSVDEGGNGLDKVVTQPTSLNTTIDGPGASAATLHLHVAEPPMKRSLTPPAPERSVRRSASMASLASVSSKSKKKDRKRQGVSSGLATVIRSGRSRIVTGKTAPHPSRQNKSKGDAAKQDWWSKL